MTVQSILSSAYPADLVKALLDAYVEVEQNFFLGKWKASELDAGHFVEAARRLLEHSLFGGATPLATQLPKFNEPQLKKYENATGDDSFRMLIPRVLWAINGIRNKRGVGHLGAVSANKMDSALILADVKWVLAEFVRLASGLPAAKTQAIVDDIVDRQLELVWKHGDVTRILDAKMPASDQVLLLLYDTNSQTADALRAAIEYTNVSRFKVLLGKLHGNRLIEYNASTGLCVLTSAGIIEAEAIAKARAIY